jgi:hypothetical protein
VRAFLAAALERGLVGLAARFRQLEGPVDERTAAASSIAASYLADAILVPYEANAAAFTRHSLRGESHPGPHPAGRLPGPSPAVDGRSA